MKTRWSIAAGAVGLALLIGAATAGAAPTPHGGPTGDPATIAYYTTVTNHFNSQPANVSVFSGAYYLGYTSATSWELSWNVPHRTYAYQHPVNETEVLAVSHRKVVWDEITFAMPCPHGAACAATLAPLRFFSTKGGSFWSVVNGSGCWYHATGATKWINTDFNAYGTQPWYVGSSPFATSPNYKPMVRQGNLVKVTSTYKYNYGAAVTELDTINHTTSLFIASSVKVGAHGASLAYSWKSAISIPKTMPKPPHVTTC